MTLLHKPYHVPHIRSGSKTQTRRDWKPNYRGPKIGSVQMVATADMVPAHYDHNSPMLLKKEDCTCFVQIQDKYRQRLGDMNDAEARQEGPYETVDEFIEGWERVNGEGSWDPDLEVTAVVYEYVGREEPDTATRIVGCPNCVPGDFDAAVGSMEDYLRDGVKDAICEYHRTRMDDATREMMKAEGRWPN